MTKEDLVKILSECGTEELASAFEDAGGVITQAMNVFIRKNPKKYAKVVPQAIDARTGLYLNGFFEETLYPRIFGDLTKTDIPFSYVQIDIDNFKSFNDGYGHEAGDKAIEYVGDLLRDSLRWRDRRSREDLAERDSRTGSDRRDDKNLTDTIAKITKGSEGDGARAGDEFQAILYGASGEDAVKAIERIFAEMERNPFTYKERKIPLSLSVGIAEYKPGESSDNLKNRADTDMYVSKLEEGNFISLDA